MPDLIIEVDQNGDHITGVHQSGSRMLPDSVGIFIFDYNKKWSVNITEPDEKGVMCRQQVWSSGPPNDAKHRFKVYIKEGEVYRVVMPPGATVIVKTLKKGKEVVKKWIHKKKS